MFWNLDSTYTIIDFQIVLSTKEKLYLALYREFIIFTFYRILKRIQALSPILLSACAGNKLTAEVYIYIYIYIYK